MTKSGSEGNGSRRELRSEAWFSGLNMFTFAHRSWNGRGYPPDVFDGRPVIGICNSWSELTTCNAHLRIVAEHVKRGVWEAGGLPLEFPTMSLGESLMKPTTTGVTWLSRLTPQARSRWRFCSTAAVRS